MHILFVHQNFPAQFGPFAFRLAQEPGFRCTFVSQKMEGNYRGVTCIKYPTKGGATEHNHYCSRTFENGIWHTAGVHDTMAAHPEIQPDLIVGHSGFGSTLFLRDLYPGIPVINLFEYYYRVTGSDLDFRPEFKPIAIDRLRARARNAMILLDLDNCDLGYCPTEWQRSRFPSEYLHKLRVGFDGIDTQLWKPDDAVPRRVGTREIPGDTKIVTYVSRGMESMRGFDIFMRTAKLICDQRSDVIFVVVGQDRICYGGDAKYTGGKSYKDWILSQDRYDLSRFLFTGLMPEADLARLLAISDLHIYLTVPFVLSWSLFNAMACGTTILASDTDPVRELVTDGKTGLLAPFFDVDAFAAKANAVLNDPQAYKFLGKAGVELIRDKYSLEVCLPRFLSMCGSAREITRVNG